MDEKLLLQRRILELAYQAEKRGQKTHTPFLGEDERLLALHTLALEGKLDEKEEKIGETSFFSYGGPSSSERQALIFVPPYFDLQEEKEKEEQGDTLSCLHIEGKHAAYAEELAHRDVLGALMSLGYEREEFGDIFVEGKEAYVFLFSSIAEEVKKALVSVRHTFIKSTLLAPKDCPFAPKLVRKKINVASPRLDCVLAELYSLSREDAQALIASGAVSLSGVIVEQNDHQLVGGERIAVRGYGKFLYDGGATLSHKGRLFVNVEVYC
jgi:RNA-binding protein YlmH